MAELEAITPEPQITNDMVAGESSERMLSESENEQNVSEKHQEAMKNEEQSGRRLIWTDNGHFQWVRVQPPGPPKKRRIAFTTEERCLFFEGLRAYGKDLFSIQQLLPQKTTIQLSGFATNMRHKLNKHPYLETSKEFLDILNGTESNYWTREEIQKLKDGLRLYGRNCDKVSEYIGTKRVSQVRNKCTLMAKKLREDPDPDEIQDYMPLFDKPARQPCLWSDAERSKFREAIFTIGKDWNKIADFMGTKDRVQCGNRGAHLKVLIKANPNHEDADMMPILTGPSRGEYDGVLFYRSNGHKRKYKKNRKSRNADQTLKCNLRDRRQSKLAFKKQMKSDEDEDDRLDLNNLVDNQSKSESECDFESESDSDSESDYCVGRKSAKADLKTVKDEQMDDDEEFGARAEMKDERKDDEESQKELSQASGKNGNKRALRPNFARRTKAAKVNYAESSSSSQDSNEIGDYDSEDNLHVD